MATTYDAFISYSHAADGKLAPALQNALQRFAKPWYRLRALHLFRDQTSLSATPGLWPAIEQALSNSRYFLLLASPEAAQSRWVQQEVAWWLEHNSPETLLIALTDGKIVRHPGAKDFDWSEAGTTALPPILKGVFVENPLWVDFRWAKDQGHLSTKNPEFQNALAALAAPLRNIPKEDLIGEDVVQHRRALLLARGAVVVLALLLVVAVIAAVRAVQSEQEAVAQRNEAQRQTRIALARQLAAQSTNPRTGGVDRRLLLGLEANRLNPVGPDILGTMLTLFETNSHLDTVLQGVAGSANEAVFSPDGTSFVIARRDGSLSLYDRARRELVAEPLAVGDGSSLTHLAVSPDGKLVAAADSFGVVLAWDLATGETVDELQVTDSPPDAQVQALAFHPQQALLAVARYSGWIILRDVERQRTIGALPAGHVNSLAFSPDGGLLAAGGGDGPLILWDVADRAPIGELSAGHVNSLAFSPDGSLLAVGGHRNPVTLWDMAKRAPIGSPFGSAGNGDVSSVAFDSEGKLLASGHGDGVIMLWNVAERAAVGEPLEGHTSDTVYVAFSPDGKQLVSTAPNDPVIVWNVTPRSPIVEELSSPEHHYPVTRLAFSPDGAYVAAGFADDRDDRRSVVALWRVENPTADPVTFATSDDAVGAVCLLADGTLAAFYTSGTVRMWDPARHTLIGEYQAFPRRDAVDVRPGEFTPEVVWNQIWAVAFSDDGTLLAVVYGSGVIRLWNVEQRSAVGEYQAFTIPGNDQIHGLKFSPDRRLLAARYLSGAVQLWNVEQHAPAGELTGGPGGPGDLAFHPDGSLLAAGGEGGWIQIWDVASAAPSAQALTRMNGTYGIAFSPNGSLLATGGGDARIDPTSASNGRIEIWDIAGRSVSEPLTDHPADVREVAWSPDGERMVSFAWNTVVVSDLRYATWEARVCAMANRNLTHEEWMQFLGPDPYRKTCPDLPSPDDLAQAAATATARAAATAQAAGDAMAAAACATELAPGSVLVAGPKEGALAHDEANNRIQDRYANVELENGVVVSRFFNPYDPFLREWDYGFFFRDAHTQKYSIYVDSQANWTADVSTSSGELKEIGRGTVPNFDMAAGGSNALCLVFVGDIAQFAVNGHAVATLDVSALAGPGDVAVATGFWYGREIDGRATRYERFAAWETAAAPAARSSPPATPLGSA